MSKRLAAGTAFRYEECMQGLARWILMALWAGLLGPLVASAQIDPYHRELIQFGYNTSFQGSSPMSAYAYYYHNAPDFLQNSNLTLRLALAPVYLDSELGISRALGENTDLGIGLAGGGFADSYDEIRGGEYLRRDAGLLSRMRGYREQYGAE